MEQIDWSDIIEKSGLDAVTKFRGDYFFLSNMAKLETPTNTQLGQLVTAEHIYLFYKSDSHDWKAQCCSIDNAFALKRMSSKRNLNFVLSDKWNDGNRLKLMWNVLGYKYSPKNPTLMANLKALKDKILIEGNSHGDGFFGAYERSLKGDNYLGLMLMRKCWELNGEDDSCALIKLMEYPNMLKHYMELMTKLHLSK